MSGELGRDSDLYQPDSIPKDPRSISSRANAPKIQYVFPSQREFFSPPSSSHHCVSIATQTDDPIGIKTKGPSSSEGGARSTL
jgi:hypothetical protein